MRRPSGRVPKQPITHLWDRHREIARRLACGERQKDIALDLGMTQSRMSIISNSPVLRERVDQLQEKADEEAKDVAQEIYIRLMLKSDHYEHRDSMAGWIYQITTNTCLNHLKSLKRRTNREKSEKIVEWTTKKPTNPLRAYEARSVLIDILDELDSVSQEIFICVYFEGMTQAQAANSVGKSRKTVGKRLKKIRNLISQKRS